MTFFKTNTAVFHMEKDVPVLLSVALSFKQKEIGRTNNQIVERSPDFLTVILQIFAVLLFSVFSVANGFIEINKTPQATPKEFLFFRSPRWKKRGSEGWFKNFFGP